MQPALDDVVRLTEAEFFMSYPHDVYARLRAESPVHWCERDRLWALSKYEDVRFVSRNPQLFASGYGIQSRMALVRDDSESGACPMRHAELRRDAEIARQGENIVPSDPPRHTFLRKMMSFAFTPRALARLEDHVHDLAVDAIARIEPDVAVDFVESVAAPVPLLVIAEMLGVPAEDRERFRRWSDTFVELGDETLNTDPTLTEFHAAQVVEFAAYFGDQLADRKQNPRDDLLTVLVQPQPDGQQLLFEDQLAMVWVLLIAGNETTRGLISGAGKLMCEHPDQRRFLVDNPDLIPNAVEEFLRMVTPVTHFCRTALEDIEIRGKKIGRGDYLAMLYPAANRDEEIWERADELDVTRRPDPVHVAFGFGEHFCLGASLARREARFVIAELLNRFPTFELAGDIERVNALVTPGIKTMPVVFHERAKHSSRAPSTLEGVA